MKSPGEGKKVIGIGLYYVMAAALAFSQANHAPAAGGTGLSRILTPTARLVEVTSGLDFTLLPGKGFVSCGAGIVIGETCSGRTFMSIAFLMAVFFFIHRFRSFAQRLVGFAAFGATACILTILANAARITGAILALRLQAFWDLPAKETIHLTVGAVCYATFLVLYFLALQKTLKGRTS